MTLAFIVLLGGSAQAQVMTPAPPLDAPHPPLSGGLPTMPPRQLPPESDPSSDPAMVNARNPPPPLPRSRASGDCPGRTGTPPPTGVKVDATGRRPGCG